MRFARLILASVSCVIPQHATDISLQQPSSSAAPSKAAAQLRTDVLKLIELDGTKKRLQINLKQMVDKGKVQMMEQASLCNSAFADEWARRMLARANVDEFVNVVVTVFETHFNDVEVRQLIAARKADGTAEPSSISPELKQKLERIMPTVLSEIIGGCTQVGAKLGGEIGQEIAREHPDYCRPAGVSK